MSQTINLNDVEYIEFNGSTVHELYLNSDKIWDDTVAPEYFITFMSNNPFTVSMGGANWDGTLQYSTNKTTWTNWDASAITAVLNKGKYKVYFRGINNTTIEGAGTNTPFILTGSAISVKGNAECLLDYATVELGNHPPIATYGFASLFRNCSVLTDISELVLGSTTLQPRCYSYMFAGTGITSIPANFLPVTTLKNYCYQGMFQYCEDLTTLPILPATSISSNAYNAMFRYCDNIKLSTTQTGEYQNEYRLPYSGTGSGGSSWNSSMFSNTGGTFTGAPDINTTYYTSNTVH